MLRAVTKKHLVLRRWSLVGVVTAIIDYIIFISVYSALPSVLVANFCAGLLSLGFNYTTHYFWSFKSKTNHIKAGFRYLINLITIWSLSTLLIKALISAEIDPRFAKLLPILLTAPLSFLGLRFFVFKQVDD
jgi:putative flippase GtrA